MTGIRKQVLTVLAFLFLISVVSGQPKLSITPTAIQDNVTVGNVHSYNFTVENTDSNQSLENVTLGGTEYLEWSSDEFSLNTSESKAVNATIQFEEDGRYNTSLSTSYSVNGSVKRGPNVSTVIDTYYPDTSISLRVFEQDFELEFGESGSSVFRVTNTGNETAYNISLNGGNVSFDRGSGFDLDPGGDDVLVEYDVSIPKPEEDATDATNQSYNVSVTVSGENFGNQSFNSSVFVPFKQYNDTEQAQQLGRDWLELERQRLEFCRSVDFEAGICEDNAFVVERNVTRTEYRTPASNYTLTNNTVAALQKIPDALKNQNDTLEDVYRRTKLLETYFDSELEQAEKNISSNLSKVSSQVTSNSTLHVYKLPSEWRKKWSISSISPSRSRSGWSRTHENIL